MQGDVTLGTSRAGKVNDEDIDEGFDPRGARQQGRQGGSLASIELTPVMNLEDMESSVAKTMKR